MNRILLIVTALLVLVTSWSTHPVPTVSAADTGCYPAGILRSITSATRWYLIYETTTTHSPLVWAIDAQPSGSMRLQAPHAGILRYSLTADRAQMISLTWGATVENATYAAYECSEALAITPPFPICIAKPHYEVVSEDLDSKTIRVSSQSLHSNGQAVPIMSIGIGQKSNATIEINGQPLNGTSWLSSLPLSNVTVKVMRVNSGVADSVTFFPSDTCTTSDFQQEITVSLGGTVPTHTPTSTPTVMSTPTQTSVACTTPTMQVVDLDATHKRVTVTGTSRITKVSFWTTDNIYIDQTADAANPWVLNPPSTTVAFRIARRYSQVPGRLVFSIEDECSGQGGWFEMTYAIPTSTPTSTATPTSTSTPTATATATATATSISLPPSRVTPEAPKPRMITSVTEPGKMLVTLTIDAPASLKEIRFGVEPSAQVILNGKDVSGSSVLVSERTVQFTVVKKPNHAATVHFTVIKHNNEQWSSFVGGGANAF